MNIRDKIFKSLAFLFFWVVVLSLFAIAEEKSITVDSAAVVCQVPGAANIGVDILRQGGTAADALTAVAFVMAVTDPLAGNTGGGGFIIYRTADGDVYALDFREKAPLAANFDLFWDKDGKANSDKSLIGGLAVGTPGTVRGLYKFHQKFGKLPWKTVLEPAIRLAKNGFAVYKSLQKQFVIKREKFERFAESMKIFYPGGRTLQVGDTLIQSDLANTLQQIALQGDSAFYYGEIPAKIVATVKKYGGILTVEDFHNYQAIERKPVNINYRNYRIYSMPPPSSGGLVLQGILNTLQNVNLSKKYQHNSAEYIAFLTEVMKYWYAYRNLYLGDPDFVDIPFNLFSSGKRAKDILKLISVKHPYPSREMIEYQQIQKEEKSETSHISIVDAEGNGVAMTYTLNGWFGSFLVGDGTGVVLNNEMDDFSTMPGSPNLYGLVQGWANAIEPGKRMLSSMTPTIVEEQGKLSGILGTRGGSRIITAVLQIILNKIDYQMSLDEALAAGRIHQQWLPDSIYYESGKIPEKVIGELNKRGFKTVETNSIGDIQAIWRYGEKWEACSDRDGAGVPAGY